MGPVTTCLPVYCCISIQPSNSTLVFSEVPCSGFCRAQPLEKACLHPPLSQLLFFVLLGYYVQLVFTSGRNVVMIVVHMTTVARAPRHVPLTNTCSIGPTPQHSFTAVLVHLQNGKKRWLRSQAMGAHNYAFLLLRTGKLRAAAPPHTLWLETTFALRLAMQLKN